MLGKIYLTSCGLKEKQESKKLYEYLKDSFAGKRALVVINATTTGHNERAILPTKQKFEEAGAYAETIVLNETNLKRIHDFDFVYVVGGDIAPLAEFANSVDFRSEVIKFLKNGGTYIGESAGSIILGKNVKWYFDVKRHLDKKYDVDLKSYKALNLVAENTYPHFNKAPEGQNKFVDSYAKEHNMKITKLNDGEWIEVDFKED